MKTQYQKYKSDIDERIRKVIEHGKFIMGPEIFELEEKLADYTGASHCISVSSGTESLEIALRALEIGPGDEVITVPFTWISSVEVIGLIGAKPVFVDIDEKTYNIDVRQIEKAITSRTKAIIAVGLFGQMPDLISINQIADRHNIVVIEDGAQSFGATQNGVRSGAASAIGSTSFFPAKPLGCFGDGGALFTNDPALADRMRAIRTHGGLERHHHQYLGTNGRLDTLQAAILLAKLDYFEEEVRLRSSIGDRYNALLQDHCKTPATLPGNTHVYAQYTITIPNRDQVSESLKQSGVPTGIYYPKCVHEQPVFKDLGYFWGDFPISEKVSRNVLSLPMHPFLNNSDQDKVVEALIEVLQKTNNE